MFQRVNNFALYLFVFSIVFESWDPFGLTGVISVARMAGLFYLASSLPFIYSRLFANETKGTLISLFFFFFFYTYSTLRYFQPGNPDQSAFSMALFQNIVMFLLITNHLLQSKRSTKYVLISFLLGVSLMGLLYLSGMGIDVEIDLNTMRLKLFGENPNMIGDKAIVASLIALYFLIIPSINRRKRIIINILLIATIPLFFSLILASGSRGAFLIFLLAGLFTLLLIKLPITYKVILFVVGIFVTIYIFDFVYSRESVMQKRLMLTIEEGNIGRRDILVKNAINEFKNYPLFGVGRFALQTITAKTRDPHNVFVTVLLASGLFGFLPFLYFNFQIFNKIIINYRILKDFFYPVMAIILFLIMIKSGGFISSKFLWFNYAILFGKKADN